MQSILRSPRRTCNKAAGSNSHVTMATVTGVLLLALICFWDKDLLLGQKISLWDKHLPSGQRLAFRTETRL